MTDDFLDSNRYSQPTIAVLINQHTGQRVPLTTAPTTIGRSNQCVVVIHDALASRVHASVYRLNDEFFIKDDGSKNGTVVNRGFVFRDAKLVAGDEITIGATCFLFVREPGAYNRRGWLFPSWTRLSMLADLLTLAVSRWQTQRVRS